jgi:hypothetical protein
MKPTDQVPDARAAEVTGVTLQCLSCRQVMYSRAAAQGHVEETAHREFRPYGVMYGNGRHVARAGCLFNRHAVWHVEPIAPGEGTR